MTNAELAQKFEQCSEFEGPMFTAMLGAKIPVGKRVQMYNAFEQDKIYQDPELFWDTIATKAWRATAFCFAAAMARTGDFK